MLPTLRTERLLLRPLTERDWKTYHAQMDSPDMRRWERPRPEGEAGERWIWAAVRRMAAQQEAPGAHPGHRAFAVCLPSQVGMIGMCSTGEVPAAPDVVQLGFYIAQPYWGCGYATEACRALLDHVFASGAVRRVVAGCYAGNAASRRVIRKMGMRPAPRSLRERLLVSLGRGDRLEQWFALDAADWRRR